ncbi:hypothetical protein J2W48_000595 [Flavobacterium piscis]|uniref:Uncharacterized protein n=1 Tax=Flavobacterium piscis TaxID=1114874 RepID=A0ABU1Y372_9FLAO|nr:hypothetical protein [Flavobacterium piscis]
MLLKRLKNSLFITQNIYQTSEFQRFFVYKCCCDCEERSNYIQYLIQFIILRKEESSQQFSINFINFCRVTCRDSEERRIKRIGSYIKFVISTEGINHTCNSTKIGNFLCGIPGAISPPSK